MISFFCVLVALVLDRLLGEPRRWHPLVGFGWLVHKVEHWSNGSFPANLLRLCGSLAVIVLVAPVVAAVFWVTLELTQTWLFIVEAALLYLCIGWRSLDEHAMTVFKALQQQDLPAARLRIAAIVSRDTQMMDEPAIVRAATESVLENGSDAVFGPIFWFVVAGAPAAVAYRLVNTLDAMWGYKSPRYLHFGWFAARLDDALNLIPARLCALCYALAGRTLAALSAWRIQAPSCASPNAGPVMAAGAGALCVELGGPALYHGQCVAKPLLGCGRAVRAGDIARAVHLVRRALLLFVVLSGLIGGVSLYV